MIIAIDGLDGSGKETLCGVLANKLQSDYDWDKVYIHSFPDYTVPSGKAIYEYLHNKSQSNIKWPEMLKKYILCVAYAYNRAEHFSKFYRETGIDMSNENGMHIFDRYWASNILYQGVGSETIEDVSNIVSMCMNLETNLGNPMPDLYYFLRVPYSILRQRLNERNDGDINESDSFQKAVYNFTETLINDYWHRDIVIPKPNLNFHYDGYVDGAKREEIIGLPRYKVFTPNEIAEEILKLSESKLSCCGLSLKCPDK